MLRFHASYKRTRFWKRFPSNHRYVAHRIIVSKSQILTKINNLYLQATSTAAGWLRICPLLDQAMHSHLNLSLPKYSSTSLRVILIDASTLRIPVWGSTKSCCIGGELAEDECCLRAPLHRKYTCKAWAARHCNVAGLFLMT